MTDILSAIAGLALTFFGVLVAIAFFPSGKTWRKDSYKYLNEGLFLLAVCSVGNAIYWGPVNQFGVMFGLVTVEQIRGPIGDVVDLLMKGGSAVAFVLALTALRNQLEPDERKHWNIITIVTYPDRCDLLDKLARKLRLK